MSRFLFVVPPLAGHVNPAVSVAQELAARGHEVVWAAHEAHVGHLLPAGAHVVPLQAVLPEASVAKLRSARGARWVGRLEAVWERLFLPLARAMLPEVEAAIDDVRPDVLVADQHALAGALAARRRELPWATSAAIWFPFSPVLDGLPKAREWLVGRLAALQREAGLQPVRWPDRSPELVLLYTTRALVGKDPPLPRHYRFVGPAIGGRPEEPGFPWDALRPCPRVFVSLGSVHADAGAAFYEALVEGLGGGPEQIVVAAAPERLPQLPENFLAQARVPQVPLLSHVAAVICHGGFNTVSEALAHGLPLVVAPVADDQPLNAQLVAAAGAGVRVRYGRLRGDVLRHALSEVLERPAYRRAARRVAASFRRAGGAAAAADELEGLALRRRQPRASPGRKPAKRSR